MFPRRACVLAVVVAAVACVSVLGHWARKSNLPQCAQDGVLVDPHYQVRIKDMQGNEKLFCGVRCAERWLGFSQKPDVDVFVVDELTGGEFPAEDAWFVSTPYAVQRADGKAVRVFNSKRGAQAACQLGGQILEGERRPFAASKRKAQRRESRDEKSTALDREKRVPQGASIKRRELIFSYASSS